jgi:hypothetical protein
MPRRSRRLVALMAVGGITFGLGAAWGFSLLLSGPEVVEIPTASSARPPASASAPRIDLSAVPVTGESDLATGNRVATCVAGYLPKDAFGGKPPKMDWLCSERDPRQGGQKLRAAVVTGGSGKVTEAMKIMSQLGWYEMAAYAVVYAGCCVDSGPLQLPKPSKDCPLMDQALNALGGLVVAERDHTDALRQFDESAKCEVSAHRAALFRRKGPPGPAEEAAFDQLVKLVQSP